MFHVKLGELFVIDHSGQALKNNLGSFMLDGSNVWNCEQYDIGYTNEVVFYQGPSASWTFNGNWANPTKVYASAPVKFSAHLDLYIDETTGETPYPDMTRDLDGQPHTFRFVNMAGAPLTLADTVRHP